jgi:signal transduction histidine kinase
MACLIFSDDTGRRIVFAINRDIIRIGRAGDNEIVSRDLRISRHHAILVKAGDGFLIRDVGSSLGVLVNNKRVEESALSDGDMIRLGDSLFTFVDETPQSLEDVEGFRASDAAVVGNALISGVEEAARSLRTVLEGPESTPPLPEKGRSAEEAFTRMESSLESLRGRIARIERARRTMQSLYEIGQVLNSSMDRENLLDLIMDLALKVVVAGRGFLMLVDKETGELVVKAARNMGEELAGGASPPISVGMARKVFDGGEPVITSDAQSDSRFRDHRSVVDLNIRSVVCVPLKDRSDRAMGVIYVDERLSGFAFDEEDRDFLMAFANYAAIAIENRRLFSAASARARMEEELRAMRRLDGMKSQLMSVVAHDVRTPLTSIRGYAEILSEDFEGMEPGQRRLFLERIVREADRLNRLTSDYLDLAKIEAGKMELRLEETEPGGALREACEALEGQAAEQDVRIRQVVAREAGRILADRDRLLQVLTNLISNALKFSSDGGEVRVAARPADLPGGRAGVLFEVEDEGPGIEAADIENLFRKFSQVGRPAGGRPRGTGLGLVVAREIVEMHEGRIGVDSSPGKGSRFHFILPVDGPAGGEALGA